MYAHDYRIDYLINRIWNNIEIKKSISNEGFYLTLGNNEYDIPENYKNIIADRMRNIELWTDEAIESNINFMVSTNWATSFGMGAPYGTYEGSIYPMYYSGERYWNNNSDKNTFLNRFLRIFHGVDFPAFLTAKEKHPEINFYSWNVVELDDFSIVDYYKLLPVLLYEITKHKEFANHMKVINELENCQRALSTLNMFSYRAEMFGDVEAEITCLKGRGKWTIKCLFDMKKPLYESLLNFMPPKMAEIYVNSRFFVLELLYKHFYKDLLETKNEE